MKDHQEEIGDIAGWRSNDKEDGTCVCVADSTKCGRVGQDMYNCRPVTLVEKGS